jgi:hypothetical protein
MQHRPLRVSTIVALALLTLASALAAQSPGRAGIRAGVGADISGGIAGGGQIDYTLFRGPNSFELGALVFGGTFSEDSNNGFNDYFEETTVIAFAAIANYLFRHSLETPGPYFVVGGGVGGFSVSWREESPTDTSLGSPLSGGGSFQEEDGTAGGAILNFGIGQRFNERVDGRIQVPTFFISGGEERSEQIVPTLTVTLGIGF